ncbi:MAG: hypothetical protein WAV20_20965, partial [Blastocatellia bacterium]
SGNTATCSFQLTVFSMCLVDESGGKVVLFDATTGDYRYCCGGVLIATGRGTVKVKGCIVTIDDTKGDRKVRITADTSAANGAGAGNAFISKGDSQRCLIQDRSMAGNSCNCN